MTYLKDAYDAVVVFILLTLVVKTVTIITAVKFTCNNRYL